MIPCDPGTVQGRSFVVYFNLKSMNYLAVCTITLYGIYTVSMKIMAMADQFITSRIYKARHLKLLQLGHFQQHGSVTVIGHME